MSHNRTAGRRVGVIGLGLLGTALAERLIAGGYDVFVYNRTRSKADRLVTQGASWTDDPFQDCDSLVLSLFDNGAVRAVLSHFDSSLRPGHLLIDTTTGDPDQAVRLGAELEQRRVGYLETPMLGSSEQARRGEAVTFVAGPQAAREAAQDLLAAIARVQFYVGAWGNASKVKLVNNLILGLHRVALAEGLAFANACGLSMDETLAIVKQGSARSAVMETKGRKMVEGDFTPQAKLSQHLKDVRLILAAAEQLDLSLPFSMLHCQTLEALESAGMGNLDNSAIIRAFVPATETP